MTLFADPQLVARIERAEAGLLRDAATLPPFRRRGVQSALLAERLTMASAAGCDVAVLTAQPGSSSMRNAQRRGFALLYVRAILGKAVRVDGAAGGSDA